MGMMRCLRVAIKILVRLLHIYTVGFVCHIAKAILKAGFGLNFLIVLPLRIITHDLIRLKVLFAAG